MKFFIVVCLFVTVAVAMPEDKKAKIEKPEKQEKLEKIEKTKHEEKYTTKYDNVNIEEILKSDRLLQNYVNCLLEKGKCTADGLELKKSLPDALKTECSKCSDKQKEGSKKIIHFLIDNKRDVWNQLEEKYDNKGEYRKKYEAEIKKEGLKL